MQVAIPAADPPPVCGDEASVAGSIPIQDTQAATNVSGSHSKEHALPNGCESRNTTREADDIREENGESALETVLGEVGNVPVSDVPACSAADPNPAQRSQEVEKTEKSPVDSICGNSREGTSAAPSELSKAGITRNAEDNPPAPSPATSSVPLSDSSKMAPTRRPQPSTGDSPFSPASDYGSERDSIPRNASRSEGRGSAELRPFAAEQDILDDRTLKIYLLSRSLLEYSSELFCTYFSVREDLVPCVAGAEPGEKFLSIMNHIYEYAQRIGGVSELKKLRKQIANLTTSPNPIVSRSKAADFNTKWQEWKCTCRGFRWKRCGTVQHEVTGSAIHAAQAAWVDQWNDALLNAYILTVRKIKDTPSETSTIHVSESRSFQPNVEGSLTTKETIFEENNTEARTLDDNTNIMTIDVDTELGHSLPATSVVSEEEDDAVSFSSEPESRHRFGECVFILARHGRIDSPRRIGDLWLLVKEVLKVKNRVNQTPFEERLRIRFCSLLNLHQKEKGYMQQERDLICKYVDNARRSSANGDTSHESKKAGVMAEQNMVDIAYLNFQANYTLTFSNIAPSLMGERLDDHNRTHRFGYITHLAWLGVDCLRVARLAFRKVECAAIVEDMWEATRRIAVERAKYTEVIEKGVLQGSTDLLLRAICKLCDAVKSNTTPKNPDSVEQRLRFIQRECSQTYKLGQPSWEPLNESEEMSDDEYLRERLNNLFIAGSLFGRLVVVQDFSYKKRASEFMMLIVVEYILGVIGFFNCKSGVDRTGCVTSLFTAFYQIIGNNPTQLWRWYFFARQYQFILKTYYGMDGYGMNNKRGHRSVAQKKYKEKWTSDMLLPFDVKDSDYASVKKIVELCTKKVPTASFFGKLGIGSSSAHDCTNDEEEVFNRVQDLFFKDSRGILIQLQSCFFMNIMAVSTKIAVVSTGTHGLKYRNNPIAAQFLPRTFQYVGRDGSENKVDITSCKGSTTGEEIVFHNSFIHFIEGACYARGT